MRVNAVSPNLTYTSAKAKPNNRRVVEPVESAPVAFKGKTGKAIYTSMGAVAGAILGFALGGPVGALIGAGAAGAAANTEADIQENASPAEHDGWADYAEDHAMHDRD